MAIDDHPFDVVERRAEIEALITSSVPRRIAATLGDLPLPWPVDKTVEKVRNYLDGDRIAKLELLLDVVKTEVRRQETRLTEIARGTALCDLEARWKEWLELLQDGAKKAEQPESRVGWSGLEGSWRRHSFPMSPQYRMT